MSFRKVNVKEIDLLKKQGCTAEKWETVFVKDGFNPEYICNVIFKGNILLGENFKNVILPNGIEKHSGIYNSYLQDCQIGDNCIVNNVANLVRYKLDGNVVIENCAVVITEGETTFGNGVKISILNEGGDRSLPIFDKLSAQIAYIIVNYRNDNDLIKQLSNLISRYADSKKSNQGCIKTGSVIQNTDFIKNVYFGENTVVQNATRLEEGSIISTKEAPVYIGDSVIAQNFIIQSGSEIDGSVLIDRCFVGQGVKIGKQYSAENSAFFANSEGYHGEACSVFAGPYTVTHHKSTLLIAEMVSFFNAGSGSNQSNHMYKLGPLHQGILERGSKTGSLSYMMWPCKVGCFTTVIGKHYANFDTTNLPFSYIMESGGKSLLMPSRNLYTVGTRRDSIKWPSRDHRNEQNKLDLINLDLFSPYTISKIINGIEILNDLYKQSSENQEFVKYSGIFIKRSKIQSGIDNYEMAVKIYIGNELVKHIEIGNNKVYSYSDLKKQLFSMNGTSNDDWIDISGMIVTKTDLQSLLKQVREDDVQSIDELHVLLNNLYEKYTEQNWRWCCALIEKRFNLNVADLTRDHLTQIIKDWEASSVKFNSMILKDASKEFDQISRIGYGIDGDDEVVKADFEAVRGSYESNSFVVDLQKETEEVGKTASQIVDFLAGLK
jgi:carbonic anhydrase/acetyltransferase-like protein (isoleucine patch superfamily)